jgi:predicted RND superfamily exporter protein
MSFGLSGFVSVYDRLVLRHPLINIIACLALVGGLASQLGNLKLDASSDSLVLEGDADFKYYRESGKLYDSEAFLVVTFQPRGDLLSDTSLDTIGALRDELKVLPGVSSVTTVLDVPLLESPPVSLSDITSGDGLPALTDAGVDRELVRQEFRNSPIYGGMLVSEDGRTTAIQINLLRDRHYDELMQRRDELRARRAESGLTPQERVQLKAAEQEFKDYVAVDIARQSELVAGVRQVVAGYRDQGELFVGGVPMIAADMISFVQSDLVNFGAGILLFMVVILASIFRGLRWVVLPLMTCVVVAVFMLGLLAWLDWRMTVISSNFVAILLIITLAICIHLVVRYRELQLDLPEAGQHELVLGMVRLMAVPCLYTTLTTAVAFTSLVVSGIRPVIDFGWMMTIGITVALLLGFILLPCVLVLMPVGKPGDASKRHEGATVQFARFTEAYSRLILPGALVLTLLSIWGISRLEVENRFIDYFHESTEIFQGMELLDAELGGTIPLEIILDLDPAEQQEIFIPAANDGAGEAETEPEATGDDPWAEDEIGDEFEDDFDAGFESVGETFEQSYWFTGRGMKRLGEIHDYVDSLPETGKVLSLATTYALVESLLGKGVSDVELALVQKSLPPDIKRLMVAPYFVEDIDQVRIALRVMETSPDLRRNQFLKDLRLHLVEELGVAEEQLHFTGMLVLYNNMLQSLFKSQILTLGAVFVAIMLMFMLLFRSFSLALIAVAPNMLAAATVLGGMGLTGIPLDMMTITIAAIVVGIGVDDTIHYVHRFMAEFPKDRNYLATMYRCHESIGRAMFYTSVTIIMGFSILTLSNFNPSIHFGLLTGLAMLVAVLGALILLPQLIMTFKPLGPEAQS